MNLAKFFREEKGATIVEYCFMCAFISLAVILGLNGIVPSLKSTFEKVLDAFPY